MTYGPAAANGAPVPAVVEAWQSYASRSVRDVRTQPPNDLTIPEPYERPSVRRQYDRGPRKELQTIHWNGIDLVPVNRDTYLEHPSVTHRHETEDQRIKLDNMIQIIKGSVHAPKPIDNFDETAFPEWMLSALRGKGFLRPTAIQVAAWPAAMSGCDVVGISETGSGKTLAYILPMVLHILGQDCLKPGEGPVGLVLLPTRELCTQVVDEVQSICCSQPELVCRGIIGGEDSRSQDTQLCARCDIIVATPGRLIDMLARNATNLRRATFIVLDEADNMLEENQFAVDVRTIMGQVRPDRQVCLFSATWQDKVEQLADELCRHRPVHINVGGVKLGACKNVRQDFWRLLAGEEKIEILTRAVLKMMDSANFGQGDKALIFCNARETVPEVTRHLREQGYSCEGLCGTLSQAERQDLLSRFRNEEFPLLVSTALLGRGHDFQKLKYVINYDMPWNNVQYVHQIGRTGRAGTQGFALTLIEDFDVLKCKEIKMVLRESPQGHHLEIDKACQRKEQDRYWRLRRERHGDGAATWQDKDKDEAADGGGGKDDGGDNWRGRGRGRRATFLAQCGERRGRC